MIKVYDSNEKLFLNNGIKILKPLKCYVYKEDNGDYYVELEDSIDNIDYYQANMIITVPTPFPEGVQAFRLSNPEKKSSKISVKARHVYFDRENYVVANNYIVDKNCGYALEHLNSNADNTSPFTTSSNITTNNTFRCVRKSLQEADEIIIERWGGHLVRDNFNVAINSTIGQDRGVVLKYAKNIKDMTINENWDNVLTKILPVGKDGILLPELYLSISEELYDIPFTKVVSFNQDDIVQLEDESDESYQTRLTTNLRQQATEYLNNNKYPKVNYNLSAHLENITDVGDTVYVEHPRLKVALTTNVIAVKYDVILKKYKSIEFGNFRNSLKNLIKTINSSAEATAKTISDETKTILENELQQATAQIWSTLGNSYVIYDGDKILVVDTLPKEEATNVIMINSAGIGFSQNGINGTFNSAWTIDGTLNMQNINVINLVADMIKGGTLKLGGNNNTNGCIEVYDSNNNLIGKVDNTGFQLIVNGEMTTLQKEINPTKDTSGSSTYLEDSTDAELIDFELEGKTTQETRSGKNLFNKNASSYYSNGASATALNSGVSVKLTTSGTYRYVAYRIGGSELLGKTLTMNANISASASNTAQARVRFGTSSSPAGTAISNSLTSSGSLTFTIPSSFASGTDGIYVLLYANVDGTGNANDYINYTRFQIEIGSTPTSYEDFGVQPSPDYPSELVSVGTYITETGKYGIEVVSQGANYFDATKIANTSINVSQDGKEIVMPIATSGNGLTGTGANLSDLAPNLKVGDTVYLYFDRSSEAYNKYIYLYGSEFLWVIGNARTITQQDLDGRVGLYGNRYTSGETQQITISNLRIVKVQNTEWEQFKSQTFLYTLNQPLRSLGEVKDLLYIKNGMLYVERKIGSVVLDGSESGWNVSIGTGRYSFWLFNSTLNAWQNAHQKYCNLFTYTNTTFTSAPIPSLCENSATSGSYTMFIFNTDGTQGTTISGWKTWLSTNKLEVQYILASSNTEEVGKIEVPSTYKTITHINTTDELEPNMNITYVMDTQITNYVQNQVSQIKITEDGILAEVNRKVDNEEIIAKLNLAIEDEQGIIEITGNQVTIDSDYFKLNADGTINSTGGIIGGYKITDNMLYAETFARYNYTQRDLNKIRNYLMETGTLTPEEIEKYDINGDGIITSYDFLMVKFFIDYNVTPTSPAKIIMQTGNSISDNAYVLQDGAGNDIVKLSFSGIYYKDFNITDKRYVGESIRLTLSAEQTVSRATTTKVTVDTVDYNTSTMLTYSSNGVVIGKDVSSVLVNCRYTAFGANSSARYIYIYKNGSVFAFNDRSYSQTMETTTVVPVTEGDYIEMYCYQEQTGSITISNTSNQTFLQVAILG